MCDKMEDRDGEMTQRVSHTLYQCFLTLPSVRVGNVFAISLQLLPASLMTFSLCSSAGVQGVLVRPFFGREGGVSCRGIP
jgi:hypothetical protein